MPSYRALGLHRYEPPGLDPRTLVVGLDVNRSSTGFAVITAAGRMLERGAIATRSADDTMEIVAQLERGLRELRDRHAAAAVAGEAARPWVVGVENYLKTFGFGKFNTRGLFALAELNAAATYAATSVFGCGVHRVHPTLPRRLYGLTTAAAKGKDGVKGGVLRTVHARFPEFYPAPEDSPAPAKTAEGDALYDSADACLVALAAMKLEEDEAALASAAEAERFASHVLEGKAAPNKRMMRRLFERVLDVRAPP